MKTVSKKLLCLLMVVFLLAAAIPFQTFAAETGGEDAPKQNFTVRFEVVKDGQILDAKDFVREEGAVIESGVKALYFYKCSNSTGYTVESFTDEDDNEVEFPLTVSKDMVITATIQYNPLPVTDHTLTINISGDAKGTATLKTNPNVPVNKSDVDDAVYAVISKADYTITGYYDAAGSEKLSDFTSLNSGDMTITVKVQQNTPPTTPAEATLTLDAGEGTIDGISGSTTTIKMTKNASGTYDVPTLPNASLGGYTFKGWFVDGNRIEAGTTKLSGSATAVAKYELKTKNLLVKGVKTTQNAEDAVLISEYYVPLNNQLLSFLNQADVTGVVRSSVPTGYSLVNNNGSILWYSSNGKELTSQATATDKAQTVLVKYQANKYTLYFQVDGGSVSPTSKEVTFDQKVGTLPTPTRKGDVFLGWFDADGTQYTSDTVYKVAGNTTLTARWQSEATVFLRIYLDGNTKTADRIVDITGKTVGNSVKRSEVEKIVLKYYSAQSGKTMKLVGLFNDDTWADYKDGKITTGDPNVTIQEDSKTNVYVVVKNAKQGGTTTPSTTESTGAVDKSNPKTGDTMLIYPAVTVMVLAAAGLVTAQIIRKKKQF